MKKIYLNQIRIEHIQKLTKEEKKETVRVLSKKYGLSYRQIEEETGIPHNTLFYWLNGKEEINGKLAVSLDTIIEHIKKFKPKYEDLKKLELLKQEIDKVLEKNKYILEKERK